jgi:putative two-component system response regulator
MPQSAPEPPRSPDRQLLDSRIVVVDDQPLNTELLVTLLGRWGFTSVVAFNDPTEVVPACSAVEPDLILLDLHMPGLDGFELMELLEPWRAASVPVPILVLTGDASPETTKRALEAGARDFVTKPFDANEVQLRVRNLLELRRVQQGLESHGLELQRRVRSRTRALEVARLEVIDRLALAAEYRDDSTQQHARRIGHTCALIAAELDLPRATQERISRAAQLHDVGKIAIPDAILLKPGRLTKDEFETMKGHTTIGARILSGSRSSLLRTAEEIALNHHERWDGGGYPNGLAGEQIPLSGRIVAIADVYDVLTHERPYKAAWSVEKAMTEMLENSPGHFDPSLLRIFDGFAREASLSAPKPLVWEMPHERPQGARPDAAISESPGH